MQNKIVQKITWLHGNGIFLAVATTVLGAYIFVPASGTILWLSLPDWFWVSLLTLPFPFVFLSKQRRVLFACSACLLSLSVSIYLIGAVRAASERYYFDQYLSRTKPQEMSETAIGSMAPGIDATELSGVPMKLSESRGKVVMLVFWASWCGPCMQDVEHEKYLHEKFQNRPFEIVGVNCDFVQELGLKAVQSHSIPWRSFWDEGDNGPISRQWGVQAWPSIFVIDDEGIIRFNYLRGDSLDVPLEILIKEAEARQAAIK